MDGWREGGKGGSLVHGVSENKLFEESQTFQRERKTPFLSSNPSS